MSNDSLVYRIPEAAWSLEFSPEALETMSQRVQRGWLSKEAVGQLYTRDVTTAAIKIEVATILRPTWASYARVRFDPKKVAAERAAMFKQGLHCVGLWHSHPEPIPHPSSEDIDLAADHARVAREILSGLVFVIVGNAPFPSGLGIWVHDGAVMWKTYPVTE